MRRPDVVPDSSRGPARPMRPERTRDGTLPARPPLTRRTASCGRGPTMGAPRSPVSAGISC